MINQIGAYSLYICLFASVYLIFKSYISSEENYNFEEDLMLNGEVEEAEEAIKSEEAEKYQKSENNDKSTKIPVPAVLPYQVTRPIFYERN